MNTTISSPNTETRDNNLVDITRVFVEFTRTRLMKRSTGEPRPTARKSLDDNLDIGTVESECSLATSEKQEHIGEDLSKDIPGGVRLPLDGRAKEHDLRRGENGGDMYDDAPSNRKALVNGGAVPLASERRYPSVFALSVVFGGAIGLTTFSMLGLSAGGGFLVGSTLVFLALASAVLISRARSESQIEEAQRSRKPN